MILNGRADRHNVAGSNQLRSYWALPSLALLAIAASVVIGSEEPRRLIVLSGQDPDGDGPYTSFDGFGSRYSATINNNGDIGFTARVLSSVGGWERSVWRIRDGHLELVTIGGSMAPGADGAVFNGVSEGFYAPAMNGLGEIAVRDTLEIGIGDTHQDNDEGIWATSFTPEKTLGLVVRENDIAPGTNGARFGGGVANSFSRPALSTSGVIVFSASLQRRSGVDETNDTGIWTFVDGELELLARSGDPATGIPGGVFEPFFNPTFAPSIPPVVGQNAVGDVVFRAKTRPLSLLDGIWKTSNGELELLALDLQPAPGTDGELFNIFGTNTGNPLVINESGVVPFIANSGNRDGVWLSKNSGIELIVRADDFIPGSSVAFFTQFGNPVDTNASESLAFPAWIDLGDGSSELDKQIWAYIDGKLRRIAAIGDMVNGTGGYIIRGVASTATLNDRGDIVFTGEITRPDETFDVALLAYSSVIEEVVIIAEIGEVIDISEALDGSDLREVTNIHFDDEIHTSNNSPEPRDGSTGLNDLGEVAYVLNFGGASAVFVTTLRSCMADLTQDGKLNFFDISAFLVAFGDQDPIVDYTGDGLFNFFDVSEFLQLFNAGCP